MAKNYFTYEQIRAVILKKLEANGVDTTEAINIPSEEAIAHLKEFANLAVEVAIGEPIAHLRYKNDEVDWDEDCLGANAGDALSCYEEEADEHGDVYTEKPLYSVKELDN